MTAAARYAVSLDLAGRRVLVVGGGPVAARRCRDLVAASALVDVVSPEVCDDLAALVADASLSWHGRSYRQGDVTQPGRAWLVHAATGDRGVDDAVVAEADAAGVWCVRAGDAQMSPAWRPAVAQGREGTASEGVTVAVTAGGDPRRAVAVRDAILAGLDSGVLPTRRRRRHGPAAASDSGDATSADLPSAGVTRVEDGGSVSLVGGGPGDEGLLTVRGRALLAAADVVVADRLGPRSILRSLGSDVEVVDVGKSPGNHPVPQDQINALLVDHARRGRRVVRLKGGDPFVFGRGGEEALYCLAHGVPVEVVPGVTSAISVPAAAGIPLTHRGVSAAFVVASGHEGPASVLAAARDASPDATLVLLMAVGGLDETARGLVEAGRRPDTPVAIIENGWTPEQRTTVMTLADAAQAGRDAGIQAPAVVVVGDVVALRDQLGDLGGFHALEPTT